jgi:hypothetical protein
VTVAPGIAPPDESRTTPLIVLVPVWAPAAAGSSTTISAATTLPHVLDIALSLVPPLGAQKLHRPG